MGLASLPTTTASEFISEGNPAIAGEVRQWEDHFQEMALPGCEWVATPQGKTRGLLVRGEGKGFVQGVREWMENVQVPSHSQAAFSELVAAFPESRCFLKQEWNPDQPSHRRLGVYLHKGLPLSRLFSFWEKSGVSVEVLRRLQAIPHLLGEDHAHFAAMAIDPQKGHFWKLYLTEYLPANPTPEAFSRLEAIQSHLGVHVESGARVRDYLGQLWKKGAGASHFYSMSFSQEALQSTLKIDVPKVSVPDLNGLLPLDWQEESLSLIQKMTGQAAPHQLAYLGIRLTGTEAIHLKYYADR